MRALLEEINAKRKEAKKYMSGEEKDVKKANALMDEVDELREEYEIEKRIFETEKEENTPSEEEMKEKANKEKPSGFKAIAKMISRKKNGRLTEEEKALITGGEDGEDYLVPEDVKLEINETRKSYKSAKDLVTVLSTGALSGSVNYENGEPAGLSDFTDGGDVAEGNEPKFTAKTFAIKWKGRLIPISKILVGAEKAGLMGYINRWFMKNAIISENKDIFDTLKKGKTAKGVKGWKALKKSINTDLDPDALFDAVIITNQTGFAILDEEEDKDGKPVLQSNPANPTEKLFQGLTVHVFADRLLPSVSGKAPIIYGSVKAGCTFVEYSTLKFAASEHFLFGKNQDCLRVMEGYDTIGTDNADSTYIYGTFEATPAPTV